MRDEAVCLKDFRDFLFGLEFGEARDAEPDRDERQSDGTGLADADLAAELLHVEHFDVEDVAGSDHIIMRRSADGRGKALNSVVGLLGSFADGLAGRGRGDHQHRTKDPGEKDG